VARTGESSRPEDSSLASLEAAAALVHRFVRPTLQHPWPLLRERLGIEVWVKHENHTPLGAFKVRGGIVYADWLRREHPGARGVIAATRGNHGQSVAFAARLAGLDATIVIPHGNSREKNAAMRALGARLIEHGHDFQAAIEESARIAGETGLHPFPSFHPLLVQGVASYALELFGACSDIASVYVPIGLGSGICGLIAARDALGLRAEIVGVVAEGAPAYALSFEAGKPIGTERAETFADGVACREPDPLAVETIRKGAARVIRVSDAEIRDAMRILHEDTHNLAEPAGAVALAGIVREAGRLGGRKVGAILTGANVDREVLVAALSRAEP
jgi:threonine dehydratase